MVRGNLPQLGATPRPSAVVRPSLERKGWLKHAEREYFSKVKDTEYFNAQVALTSVFVQSYARFFEAILSTDTVQ